MRHPITTLLIIVCTMVFHSALASAATATAETPAAPEPGVSQQLAEARANRVSHVRYQLGFTIPRELTAAVTFSDTIRFDATGHDDLWIDFRPTSAEAIAKEMVVNGKRVAAHYANEHYRIPGRLLRARDNCVVISGVADDKTLNRHSDYLYTLFVPAHARSAFACFDQPDLKATFSLSLTLPDGWQALSSCGDRPLPTYLFSFTAGRFQRQEAQRDGRTLTALYRETDPAKVAQLSTVFDEVALSIRWMERYTGIRMPFSRYGFVVLPGYQFGGMEHPGAIQFTDREIFLGPHPTPDEELTRLNLLAHETAHLWFGDMVTMRWFDDVWTKEVFANLMASKVAREQFPDIDHDLNFLHSYYMRAMSTDRTDGTHPIQQPLQNLNQAGLLYGNIIYEKAPIMMQKLEELMGSDLFQRGLQAYLRQFAYRNATWDDLVHILDSTASSASGSADRDGHHRSVGQLPSGAVRAFSEVWVKEKGMPTIYSTFDHDTRTLTIRQEDPFGRGLAWPQTVRYAIVYRKADGSLLREDTLVDLSRPEQTLRLKDDELFCIHANSDGKGYGRFCAILVDDDFAIGYDEKETPSEVERYAAAMNTMNGCMPNVSDKEVYPQSMTVLFRKFANDLPKEQNALTASALCSYLTTIEQRYANRLDQQSFEEDGEPFTVTEGEQHLWTLSSAGLSNARKQLLRWLGTHATTPAIVDSLYAVWHDQSNALLDRADYTRMAYHLAIMRPDRWQQILATQRSRLTNADELRAFDFIARACTPDTLVQDSLFRSLALKENRLVEPWAAQLLSLINDPSREPRACRHIRPALDLLEEIQRTGDIFFPTNWLAALLGGHSSAEAATAVSTWLDSHPAFFPPLRRKVLELSFLLRTASPIE